MGGLTVGPIATVEAIYLGGEGKVCPALTPLPYGNFLTAAAKVGSLSLVCGGADFSGQECFRFEPATGRSGASEWQSLASLRRSRYGHAAVQLTEDIFWMTGTSEHAEWSF